jgi:hypothetical protein
LGARAGEKLGISRYCQPFKKTRGKENLFLSSFLPFFFVCGVLFFCSFGKKQNKKGFVAQKQTKTCSRVGRLSYLLT